KQIQDEDILAIDKLPRKLVEKYGLEKVLTKKQFEKLKEISKKEGIHEFPIHTNLPRFGPYVLAGLLLVLWLGDFIFVVFSLN
ncbi:MAG: hypothetical protein ABH803_02990, partial [Candidatus Micrarchaeota archaeon]